MLVWLIVATLAWGGFATFTAIQHASGANTVVAASEPLTNDALQIWQSLSDANDAASAAILAGGLPPQALIDRYNSDIAMASKSIVDAALRGGPESSLNALATQVSAYQGEVHDALSNNRIGYPVGAAYLRQASGLMTTQILPVANSLYMREDAALTVNSAQATGLPLIVITVVGGLALGFGYYRCGRWLTRRTNRVLNGGLLLASVVGTVALLWLAGAYVAGRSDLLASQAQGSMPVTALANADIAVLKAHADEALTLINNSGDDTNEKNPVHPAQGFQGLESLLGPGPGTLLTIAQADAAGSPAAASASAAVADAPAWFSAHKAVRAADNGTSTKITGGGTHKDAVAMVISGTAGSTYQKLSDDLSTGITADDAAFASNASSGQGAFGGLEPGMIIATLIMIAGLAWGLSRRLAEYR